MKKMYEIICILYVVDAGTLVILCSGAECECLYLKIRMHKYYDEASKIW